MSVLQRCEKQIFPSSASAFPLPGKIPDADHAVVVILVFDRAVHKDYNVDNSTEEISRDPLTVYEEVTLETHTKL